jgi:predicted RNA polymerase sigma factor
MGETPTRETIEAVWRIESARLLGGLVRLVRDLSIAEDLAQEALLTALERWPHTGVPNNPGAWLMATAKNRAIDQLRRRRMLDRTHESPSPRPQYPIRRVRGARLGMSRSNDVLTLVQRKY